MKRADNTHAFYVPSRMPCRIKRHDQDGERSCVLNDQHEGGCLFRVISDHELELRNAAREGRRIWQKVSNGRLRSKARGAGSTASSAATGLKSKTMSATAKRSNANRAE